MSISEAIAIANSEGHGKAIPILEKLVDAGESVANCYLGMIYEYGNSNTTSKFEYARFYYEQAVEDGWVPGLIGLGRIYYYGLGVERDVNKAFDYFYQIHSVGLASPVADYYLGQMFQLGEGREVDLGQAEFFFNRSIKSGYQWSRIRLAMIARSRKQYGSWIAIRISLLLSTIRHMLKYGSKNWRIRPPTCTMGPSSLNGELMLVNS